MTVDVDALGRAIRYLSNQFGERGDSWILEPATASSFRRQAGSSAQTIRTTQP